MILILLTAALAFLGGFIMLSLGCPQSAKPFWTIGVACLITIFGASATIINLGGKDYPPDSRHTN
jgi:hypothetical protein